MSETTRTNDERLFRTLDRALLPDRHHFHEASEADGIAGWGYWVKPSERFVCLRCGENNDTNNGEGAAAGARNCPNNLESQKISASRNDSLDEHFNDSIDEHFNDSIDEHFNDSIDEHFKSLLEFRKRVYGY